MAYSSRMCFKSNDAFGWGTITMFYRLRCVSVLIRERIDEESCQHLVGACSVPGDTCSLLHLIHIINL